MNSNNIEQAIIYDDHRFFGQAFTELLTSSGRFSQVTYYAEEADLLYHLENSTDTTTCLFIDFFIDKSNTLYLINQLRKLSKSIYIIVLSCVDNPIIIEKIIQHKVDGILSKIDDTNEVLTCLNSLASKQIYFSSSIKELLKEHSLLSLKLSSRELEILSWLSAGKSTQQIAQHLYISVHTVLTHRKNIIAKLGVKSITQAIVYAVRLGLIDNR